MKRQKAAITLLRPRQDVEQLWRRSDLRPGYIAGLSAAVTFKDAPGARGTEIHVDLGQRTRGGVLGEVVEAVTGRAALPKVKDDLRRFKQQVETGEIPRSDASPAGERVERKFKQRPAQPLPERELEEVGLR